MRVRRLSKELNIITINLLLLIIPNTSNINPQLSPITDIATILSPSFRTSSRIVSISSKARSSMASSNLISNIFWDKID